MKQMLKLRKLHRWIINIVDIELIALAFYLGFMFEFNFRPAKNNLVSFINLLPFIVVFAFVFNNIYDIITIEKKKITELILSTILSLTLLHIATRALCFVLMDLVFPRRMFIFAFAFQCILLLLWKAVLMKLSQKIYSREKVAIIGDKRERDNILKKILLEKKDLWQVKHLLEGQDMEKIKDVMNAVDVVLVCPKVPKEKKSKLVNLCLQEDRQVYIIPELYETVLINSQLTQLDDVPAFKVEKLGLSMEQRFLKRAFDLLVSCGMLIVFSPFMLLSALLVKISSKGPILYCQERLTLNDKPFKIYKFRTMVKDAEKYTGPVLASQEDPRITKVGKFLRTTRLDELPQLFNVLKGDMSIVGPRPERDCFAAQIIQDHPDFSYRTRVKAGITGLAQVQGKYTTDPMDKLRYDLLYIRNYSFSLDLLLIFRTLQTMITKAGSQGATKDPRLQKIFKEKKKALLSEVRIADTKK